MATIAEIRAKYPQYQDMDDATLAGALHAKFYADMPPEEFAQRIGLSAQAPEGNADRHSMAVEGGDMFTMGLQPKINALGGAAIDKAVSLVTGDQTPFSENYDRRLAEQRGDQAAYEEQNPVKSRIAQAGGLAGSVAALPALTPFKAAAEAAPVVKALKAVGNVATTGGTYGGISGVIADADNLEDRAKNAATGAAWGAALAPLAIPAAKIVGKVANVFTKKPASEVPTISQIRTEKTKAYADAKDTGLVVKPEAFKTVADDITKQFEEAAHDADLEPKSAVLLKRVQEARDKSLSLTEIDNLRKKAVRVVRNSDGEDSHFASTIIESVDDFLDNLTPEGVVSGDPKAANEILTKARELAKRQRKSEVIETALSKAENAVGANYTQAGWQTAVQQQFRRIADNPKVMKLYNPDEVRMIKAVVQGAKGQVLLNIVRKFNPANAFALVGATMNPALGVPAMLAGQAAKMGSARITGNAARAADETVRLGRSLPRQPPNRLGEVLQGPLAQMLGRAGGDLSTK